jgi:[ribosomal protein S18]-alanine N-acetyltransferase
VGYHCAWVVFDELHLQNLAVHPDWRRKGIGSLLVRHALELGRGKKTRTAILEVRRSNEEALGLYRKFGFEVVGVRRNYYPEEGEDALVMVAILDPADRGLKIVLGLHSSGPG